MESPMGNISEKFAKKAKKKQKNKKTLVEDKAEAHRSPHHLCQDRAEGLLNRLACTAKKIRFLYYRKRNCAS
jgi:hypothetical protein